MAIRLASEIRTGLFLGKKLCYELPTAICCKDLLLFLCAKTYLAENKGLTVVQKEPHPNH